MDYQHRVTVWNYETGVRTQGIFHTRKEAEEFMVKEDGHQKSYSAEDSTWVYGVFEDRFDVQAAHAVANEWMAANGGVTGRD